MSAEELLREHRERLAVLDGAAVALDELLIAIATQRRLVVADLLWRLLADFAFEARSARLSGALNEGVQALRVRGGEHPKRATRDQDVEAGGACARTVIEGLATCFGAPASELLARVLRRWMGMRAHPSIGFSSALLGAIAALEEVGTTEGRTPRHFPPPPPAAAAAATAVGAEFARARARHAAGGR